MTNKMIPPNGGMRICESGSADCTGLSPCEFCYAFIFVKILPNAIRVSGAAGTRETAQAALRAFDEGWKKALEERVAEKQSASGNVQPFTTQPLLEFLAFKESRRKILEQKKKEEEEREPRNAPTARQAKSKTKSEDSNENGNGGEPVAPEARGTPLVRGDLKRLADKQAKESLAPNKSHSVIAGNGTDPGSAGVDSTDDSSGTGRH